MRLLIAMAVLGLAAGFKFDPEARPRSGRVKLLGALLPNIILYSILFNYSFLALRNKTLSQSKSLAIMSAATKTRGGEQKKNNMKPWNPPTPDPSPKPRRDRATDGCPFPNGLNVGEFWWQMQGGLELMPLKAWDGMFYGRDQTHQERERERSLSHSLSSSIVLSLSLSLSLSLCTDLMLWE